MRFYFWGIIGVVMAALAGAAFWQVFGNHAHAGNLSRLEWSYGVEWTEAKPELEWTVDEPKAVEPPKPQPTPYELANAASARDKTPLVTFVNVPERKLPGVATVYHGGEFDDSDMPRIIYSKGGFYVHTFSATTSDGFILDHVMGRLVQPSANPFREMPPVTEAVVKAEVAKTADGDLDAAGRWPHSVPKVDGLVRYKPAKWTQAISVLNGSDHIEPVHRSKLERRWQKPGGMADVTGFTSDLYHRLPSRPKVYVDNIMVLNSFGHFQPNRGYKFEFVDGSEFHDVLSNSETGKPFEHRVRKKINGRWSSNVVFESEANRPARYVGLKQSCNSCHGGTDDPRDFPGSGAYAQGLLSGGDGVFSLPFPNLER